MNTGSGRADGRPFVLDENGHAPRYVVEQDADGADIVLNQFTGDTVFVGFPPYPDAQVRGAIARLSKKGPF